MASSSMSKAHPVTRWRDRMAPAASAVKALNPHWVSRTPGTARRRAIAFPDVDTNLRGPRCAERRSRTPITTSAPCSSDARAASTCRSGVARSASMNSRWRPTASSSPSRTAPPLPMFGISMTRRCSIEAALDRAAVAVSSRLATTTTTSTVPRRPGSRNLASVSRLDPSRWASRYAGMTIDRSTREVTTGRPESRSTDAPRVPNAQPPIGGLIMDEQRLPRQENADDRAESDGRVSGRTLAPSGRGIHRRPAAAMSAR